MTVLEAPSVKKPLWRRFLVISGLSAAALAAPLLDLYGKNPEVFVANRTSPFQLILFGLLVVVVPPVVGLGILWLAGMGGSRSGNIVYLVLVGFGGATTGLVIARQAFPDSTAASIGLALLLAIVVIGAAKWVEGTLALFSIALPAVLFLFLAVSPTSRLIWDQPSPEAVDTDVIGRPSSIVFLQLDEFPTASLMNEDGSINDALFPNFARLANSGTWYRNALSVSMATTHSVPSILDGRLGEPDLAPTATDHPNNLFTLLGKAYEMHVIEWVADLCPQELCKDYAGRAPARFTSLLGDVGVVYGHLSLPPPVRDHLPSIDNTWKGFLGQDNNPNAPPVAVPDHPVPRSGIRSQWVDWIQRLINGISKSQPPTLSYAHLQSPHVPWQVNPTGTQYSRPEQYSEVDGVQGSGFWVQDPDLARLGYQRHLYQLGFLDQMLGSLFKKMDETGTWDDTLIVVVADHGASFVPGEHRRWPYANNRDDLYRVPLFVKYPGQTEGETRDEPAFTIDILPTIVDALDIKTDWKFDGQSLLDIQGTNRPHQVIYWCCSRETASTDLTVLFDQVRRNHQWVPRQDSWDGVAAVGPYGNLVGTRFDDLAPEKSDELHWVLDHADSYASIDLSSGVLQTLITGRLEVPQGVTDNEFLIGVNGQIAGTGFLLRDEANAGEIRGLISEESLRDGANSIVILVHNGQGWLTGSTGDVTLQYLADDGHVLQLKDEGNRRVQIDKATKTSSGWTIVGWAADVSKKVPPDRIYLFAGDTLVAFGPPNLDNPNVVKWYESNDLLRTGFSFDIAAGAVPVGVDRLTVIAEFGDYAIGDPVILDQ